MDEQDNSRLIGGIDYDRGAIIKQSKDQTLPEVIMYKDEPGIYYAANGRKISVEAARLAGFDVNTYEKLRKRALFQKKSLEQWDEVNRTAQAARKVVFEKGGYRVVDLGLERHIVEDSDGFLLTPGSHLSLAEAKRALELFIPVGEEVEAEAMGGNGDGDSGGAGPGAPRNYKKPPRD